jgi:Flp pilus assembly pilin Flp
MTTHTIQFRSLSRRLTDGRSLTHFMQDDTGSATAEYAIATMAAVGFAGLLVVILRGDDVKSILFDMIRRALLPGG